MKKISYRAWAIFFALLVTLLMIPKAKKLTSPDFKVFYVAARHVLVDPENLYRVSPDRYLYPPTAAILLTPFALTDHYAFFQWAWHVFLGFILALLGLVSAPALAAMVVLSRYLANTFGYGQINLVVIGVLAWSGYLVKRRPQLAGAAWAFATTLKVYPLVFAPQFLPRARRPGLAAGVVAGAALALLPFIVFGPSLGITLYGEFFEALRAKGSPLHSHNQSIQALLMRLFSGESFHLHAQGDVNWAIAVWPSWIVRSLGLALGGLAAALSWKKALRDPAAIDGCLSAGAFSLLFLSHIVWKDYFLFLYFPLRELFAKLGRRQAVVLASIFLAMVTFSSMDVVGAPVAARLDAGGIHLWAGVIIWAAWLKT